MKSNLSILLFCFFSLSFSQVRWMTMDQAITAQKANPKKIIVDFYADWNTACKEMDKETFIHPEILKYLNDKFYIVKFNSEGDETVNIYDRVFKNPEFQVKSKGKNGTHQFAKFMNINAYPTLIFLDENLQPITNLVGKFTPKELEPYLNMIATNQYKSIKTRDQWENYQRKFKSKIKE